MYDPAGEFFPSYGTTTYGTTTYGTAYGTAVYGDARDAVEVRPPTGSYEHGLSDPGAATLGTGVSYAAPDVPGPYRHEAAFAPDPRGPGDERPPAGTVLRPHARPRRRPGPSVTVQWPQVLSALFVALTAATFVVVCVVGWMVSYDPLQGIASPQLPRGLSHLWPIIVNGPWLACCLSVLRAALEGRRVVYSWAVLILFSGFSMALCIANEPHVMPDIAVAGLPPLTAVASLHQLVRQLIHTNRNRLRPPVLRPASHRMSR